MIVQPDFLDHWKTGLLIELLDDQCAPMYVLRLWAHCQNRKTHGFPRVNPAITKAICKAPHSAEFFENCMVEAGFIEIIDNEIVAHDWADVNASLITSWENGKKGGRPKKKPTENPRVTQAKPAGNPNETDKRREEKIRVDEKTQKKKSRQSPPSLSDVIKYAQSKAQGNPAPYITKAKEAYEFYSSNMRELKSDVWKDGNGNTVKNWKLKLNNNWFSKVSPEANKPKAI